MRPAFSTRPATKEDLRSQLRHVESAASGHQTAQAGETVHLFFMDRRVRQSMIIQSVMNDSSVAGAWLSGMFEGLLGIFPVISFHRGREG